jgi:signal transduction histidine kinase
MSEGFPPPADPRWPRLLALAVHELRTPVTVVAGYIRMLLKDRAGPLSDQQRRLLEEAEKSCGRLSGLTSEMSDLANLEAGTATFNRNALELGPLLDEVIASLPPLPDREVTVTLDNRAGRAAVEADAVRLRAALTAVLVALRREIVTSTELVIRLRAGTGSGTSGFRLVIAEGERLDAVDRAGPSDLAIFDEWRGGCGLSLAIARRIVTAHGGQMWSPAEDSKAGAVIEVPQAVAAGAGHT